MTSTATVLEPQSIGLAESGKGHSITEATICLSLSLGGFGTRQRVDPDDIAASEDAKQLLHVSKDILESDALDNLRRQDAQIRGFVVSRSLPSRVLRGGIYVLPIAAIEQVDDALKAFVTNREALVEKLVAEYEDPSENGLIAKAKARLGSRFFDLRDYPPASRVKASYTVEARYLQIEVPTSLKNVSLTLYQRELEKAKSYAEAMLIEAKNGLRLEVKDVMKAAVERLAVGIDDEGNPKPKMFVASSIKKFDDFLELFELRNGAVGDAELAELVKKARNVSRGVGAAALRENLGVRELVRTEFEKIHKAVEELPLDEAPSRRIVFAVPKREA